MCSSGPPPKFRHPTFSKIVRDVRLLRLKVRAGSPGVGLGSGSGFAVTGGNADLELDLDEDEMGSGSRSQVNPEAGGVGLGLNVIPRVAWAEEISLLPPSSPLGTSHTDPNTDGNVGEREVRAPLYFSDLNCRRMSPIGRRNPGGGLRAN
jgi:hypothetical protein